MALNLQQFIKNDYLFLAKKFPFHHAILFQETKENDAELLIELLSQFLLCHSPKNEKPCEICSSCQLFLAKNHPDFYFISSDKKMIGIDYIRNLQEKLFFAAHQEHNKVIVIQSIEKLTEAAANSLLKILEEPPKNTYFLLSCTQKTQIKKTILSRCFLYPVKKFSSENIFPSISSFFKDKNKNELLTALKLSENSPFFAFKLLENKNWEKRKLFFKQIEEFLKEKTLFFLIESYEIDYFSCFYFIIFDSICLKLNQPSLIQNLDQMNLIKKFSDLFSLNQLIELNKKNINQQIKMRQNLIDEKLLFAEFLLEFDIFLNEENKSE